MKCKEMKGGEEKEMKRHERKRVGKRKGAFAAPFFYCLFFSLSPTSAPFQKGSEKGYAIRRKRAERSERTPFRSFGAPAPFLPCRPFPFNEEALKRRKKEERRITGRKGKFGPPPPPPPPPAFALPSFRRKGRRLESRGAI